MTISGVCASLGWGFDTTLDDTIPFQAASSLPPRLRAVRKRRPFLFAAGPEGGPSARPGDRAGFVGGRVKQGEGERHEEGERP